MRSLERIWLYHNKLTQPLPVWLGELPNLNEIGLHNNQLQGPIPPEWASLSKLTLLTLQENNIRSQLPPTFSTLSLQRFDVSDNLIYGTIPESYSNFTNITGFNIDGNSNLTGSLKFLERARWNEATEVTLNDCSFTGEVSYKIRVVRADNRMAPQKLLIRIRKKASRPQHAKTAHSQCAKQQDIVDSYGLWVSIYIT